MKNFIALLLISTLMSGCVLIPDLNPNQSNIVVINSPNWWVCDTPFFDPSLTNVDINQDGLIDFEFHSSIISCGGPYSQGVGINSITGKVIQSGQQVKNEVVAKFNNVNLLIGNDLTVGFSENQVYNNNLGNGVFWKHTSVNYINDDACNNDPNYNIFPAWNATEYRFIVVRFKINGQFHYGWLELDSLCSLGRMAYNTEAGLRIQPGQIK